MPGRDIIVIGASAGGVEALKALVKGLPPNLPASIFIVLHVPEDSVSVLPRILARSGHLPAIHPEDGQTLQQGNIYVAPPDSHLLVKRGFLRLVRGPKENGHRPAVDPLFRTAARVYGRRVIGIVLSGALDDGTAGMVAIKERGGVTIAQDPQDALYSGMPLSAIENATVDFVLPLSDIAPLLIQLVQQEVEEGGSQPVSDEMDMETDIAEMDSESLAKERRPGTPSRFTCPECSGVLWELDEKELLRFRCRVGHAYSVETLLARQFDGVEAAIWAALRALEENISLSRQVAMRLRSKGHKKSADRFERQAAECERQAEVLREVLTSRPPAEPVASEAQAIGQSVSSVE